MKRYFAPKLVVVFLVLVASLFAQDSTFFTRDSAGMKIFGIKPHLLQFSPLHLTGDSLKLQFKRPEQTLNLQRRFYDLNRVMPSNRFLWDYRESSYYTPIWVQDKLARIMNRPTPGEVFPLFPLALIAAKLAWQQMEIGQKIAIKPEDYLIESKYWPILKALWEKSPQSAEQLYERKEINKNRTLQVLKQDLQFLVDQKLLRHRKVPGQDTQYFAAQSRGKAILLLEKALRSDRFTMQQKKRFLDFKNYLTGKDD